eukprot:8373887-Alexandrium_andersonii.AAC.1
MKSVFQSNYFRAQKGLPPYGQHAAIPFVEYIPDGLPICEVDMPSCVLSEVMNRHKTIPQTLT